MGSVADGQATQMTEMCRETHEIRSRAVRDMVMAEYHAVKALSASGIHALVEECPARFWHDSPWGPGQPERAPHFDIGTALHLAVLEPATLADRTVLVPYDTYQKKEARELRDEAYASARTPLKPAEFEIVAGMARAIEARPDVAALFRGGDAEISLFWSYGRVPCKARPDYLSADRKVIVDAKTAMSANPRVVANKAITEGWHVRDFWYRYGVATATGVSPHRYVFVVIEKDPPHLIELYELDERAVAWGQQIVSAGLRSFVECQARGEWPTYSRGKGSIELSLPTWAEYRLAEREQAGEFSNRITAEESRFGRELLAP